MTAIGTNWAGNYVFRAVRFHHPASLDEVPEIVRRAARIRVVGSRHSFTDIGDSDELLALNGLPAEVSVDRAAGSVTVAAGLTYAQLADALRAAELALPAMASLPHISVGGAIATGTHGSGNRFGNLATAVAGLELVTSDGSLLTLTREDPDFAGAVVGLGAVGAVTKVTLDVEPAYDVRQRVYLGMGWEQLTSNFDAVMGAADSVSVFTRWAQDVDQVWLKRRVVPGIEEADVQPLFGAAPATVDVHPVPGQDPINCTPQLGVPGLWSDRLPHFKSGFAPSAGAEIQSEYFVGRPDAVAAVEALRAIGDQIRPVLQISEIRTIASDQLWMSPHYGRDSAAFHFTWLREPEQVRQALILVEAALRPFAPRPHWAKVFVGEDRDAARRYERLGDFTALLTRLDPRGAFRNAWLERVVLS